MRKLVLACAVVGGLVSMTTASEAQWFPWVVRGAAVYGGYSCLRYGCGPIPPVSMWGRPRGYGGPPGPYAYYRPSYYCSPRAAYYGMC